MKPAPIRLFPDPILRQESKEVSDFGESIAAVFRLLEMTMRSQSAGIGIAAPQIGIAKKIALVDVSSRVPGADALHLVNPVILERKLQRPSREGCMSLPDYTAQLIRHDRIRLRWQDETGRFREKVSTGIEAVCIQHEVDHLLGILFFDHVACLKTDMLPRGRGRLR